MAELAQEILNRCVEAIQKYRSIMMENGLSEDDELVTGDNVFSEGYKNLLWQWSNLRNVEPMDAVNAVTFIKLRLPAAAFLLDINMEAIGLSRYYDNPIAILEDTKQMEDE